MIEEIWLPQIDTELCTGCKECIDACPTDALGLMNGQAFLVKPDACNYCGVCELICPVDAITLPYQIVLESNL